MLEYNGWKKKECDIIFVSTWLQKVINLGYSSW